MSVIQYLERIVKKQKNIGYSMYEYMKPGLDKLSIEFFERKYNIEFNIEFKDYLTFCNGMLNPTFRNSMKLEIIPSRGQLVGLDLLSDYIEKNYFSDYMSMCEIDIFSMNHLPIIENGTPDSLFVNLDKEDKFYRYILETSKGSKTEYIFSSMTRMFECLCIAYESGIIWYNRKNEYLEVNFSEYFDLCRRIDPM